MVLVGGSSGFSQSVYDHGGLCPVTGGRVDA